MLATRVTGREARAVIPAPEWAQCGRMRPASLSAKALNAWL
ncbi:MAG: hypothetical protein QOD56_1673 [Gammaproteobacteria bacterium]|jgi:hypothetical protein|nr:hypothetical protein [Gammaproteobacteria bacterium]